MTESEAITTASALTLENARLHAELRARADELRGWHGRLSAAIDAERRRIERDLHDGIQGRLVSIAMALGLLEAKLSDGPHAAKPVARKARQAITGALAELRHLTRGLYPSVLAERGLPGALEELCDDAPIRTVLSASVEGRLPIQVEAAAYFVAGEAITNALKHSHATQLHVAASGGGDAPLIVEVTDNGIGGAAPKGGSGLRGLADRVEVLGGRVIVSSAPGLGTSVRAEIPCAWSARRADDHALRTG